MRVTRIEIFGFKSFMERLQLPLDGGITGVVGPNGCGKSNIIDAVRWVLGETRASNLRGSVLEDVIFNGTDKLRPLGLAEVTLTIRASQDNFFADLVSPSLEAEMLADLAAAEDVAQEATQVTTEITEELAAAESNLSNNGKPRLTVISGNAVGHENLDLSQAEIVETSMLTSGAPEQNPEQVGPIIPQAEAAAPTLLTRFSWLKSVNEVQVTRRLYRSGESEFFINRVPCRLKDLKDFYRAVNISARAYTIVAQGEVARVVSARPEERRMIIEEAAGVLGFRDKIASATRRLEDTEINISRLDDIIKEVERQVSSLRRQAAKAKNRESLKTEIAELETKLYRNAFLEFAEKETEITVNDQSLTAREAGLQANLQKLQAQEDDARSELIAVDVAGDTLRNKIDSIKEELNNRAQQRSEKQSRVNELKAFSLARDTEIKRLQERQNTLHIRSAEAQKTIEELRVKEESLLSQISGIETVGEDELKRIAAGLDQLRIDLRRKEQVLRENRDALISSESSLKAIREQLIAASPVNQLKKTLSEESSGLLREAAAGASLFIDGLTVPPQYVKAAQAVLHEKAQFLVSEKPYQLARNFVNQILTESKQTHGLGLGVFRAGAVPVKNDQAVASPPFPRLLDLIQVEQDAALAATRVLERVYLADSLEAALTYFENNADPMQVQGITLVTSDGDLLTDYSFFSLRHEGGLIQLKNKAEDLNRKCAEIKQIHDRLTVERDSTQVELATTEQKHREVLRETQARQTQMREFSNQQGALRGRLQAEKRLLEQSGQDVDSVVKQIREAEVRIEEFKREAASVEQEILSLVPDAEQKLHAELRHLNEEYLKLDSQRKAGRNKLSEFSSTLHDARGGLDKLRSQVSQMQLEKQKIELGLQHLQEKVLAEYGAIILSAVTDQSHTAGKLSAEMRAEYTEEASKLRARVQREGEVDPTSIEQYELESKRFEDLERQLKDLKTAAATLKRTIEKLTKTSEARFIETFAAVRSNFARLVPRLFGGGKGDLQLLDPANPLQSGVEIIARPPGKKLKSIELLSGGEKALCATALIFAMFIERPSPLCVLDEVDAPLDDANLVRFLSLVKEMSAKTQFIMITHNKQSMTMADNLVGVTMQEPGATKILTVSLQEAYQAVA